MIEKGEKNRVDAQKNKAKIIKEVLENPLQSQREIAKKLGIGKTTVHEHLKELPNSADKDDRILGVCEDDFTIVKLTQKETIRRLKSPKKESFSDIIKAGTESTRRYTIFKGEITDKSGGFKSTLTMDILANMTINEINEYKKQLLEN